MKGGAALLGARVDGDPGPFGVRGEHEHDQHDDGDRNEDPGN
ncbi:hypothetical protein M8Z33_07555 [Streptomyces sp. ZAF1911]|nr:hypothetical protein [Streptomyces sp. ZAF1911]MDD9376530.1 hypothetical protein [Streptomyces sp. ZAF1911]